MEKIKTMEKVTKTMIFDYMVMDEDSNDMKDETENNLDAITKLIYEFLIKDPDHKDMVLEDTQMFEGEIDYVSSVNDYVVCHSDEMHSEIATKVVEKYELV